MNVSERWRRKATPEQLAAEAARQALESPDSERRQPLVAATSMLGAGSEAINSAVTSALGRTRTAAENAAAVAVGETVGKVAEEVAGMIIDSPVLAPALRASAFTVASPVGRAGTKVALFASATPIGKAVGTVGSLAASSPVTRRLETAAKETLGAALVNDTTSAALSVVVDAALDATVDVAIPMLIELSVDTAVDIVRATILQGAGSLASLTPTDADDAVVARAVNLAFNNPLSGTAQKFVIKAVQLAARGAAASVVGPIVRAAAEQARGEIIRTLLGEVIVNTPVALTGAAVSATRDIVTWEGGNADDAERLLHAAITRAVVDVVQASARPAATLAVRSVITGTVVTTAINAAVDAAQDAVRNTAELVTASPGRLRGFLRWRRRDAEQEPEES
ncbi:hypothetical protein [Lolliginicoccus suaedae]|uniref:hypothetical protein n=1 Tax=Lolliginicoccus suaedae TaxID=2605429 RepID=UPI0011EEED50|nr:hypothetical protein [Lolliginicoccus suaedae]